MKPVILPLDRPSAGVSREVAQLRQLGEGRRTISAGLFKRRMAALRRPPVIADGAAGPTLPGGLLNVPPP
jgi:hypothetical protein